MIRGLHYRSLPRRLRRPTLLIVGCGDVGRRMASQWLARHPSDRRRIVGTARGAARAAELRAIGIVPLQADLDAPAAARRLAPLSRWLVNLAPPPAAGAHDPRSARLIHAVARGRARLARTPAAPPDRPAVLALAPRRAARRGRTAAPPPRRWVYISTTGVYGDCAGAYFDETRPVAPASDRAARRVDAELRHRRAVAAGLARASILRVPGIYDSGARLPVERLRKGLPALVPDDDVFTNHIHADDLAGVAAAALFRGRPGRVVHAVDDTELKMADYFDQVADALGLPRPPRVPRAELARMVSPVMLSFMSESRRLANRRLRRELRARLRYPTVAHALAQLGPGML